VVLEARGPASISLFSFVEFLHRRRLCQVARIKARNEDRAVQRREPKRPTAPEPLRRTKFRLERFCRWFCDPALNWIEASRVSYSTIAQDVPLPNGATIRRGSQIEKRIFEVTPAGGGSGAKVSMPFERLNVKGRCIPVVTNLRAIAGFMEKWRRVAAARECCQPRLARDKIDDGQSRQSLQVCVVGGICDRRGVSPDGGFVPDRCPRPERRELRWRCRRPQARRRQRLRRLRDQPGRRRTEGHWSIFA
jgi:hypothetical protein